MSASTRARSEVHVAVEQLLDGGGTAPHDDGMLDDGFDLLADHGFLSILVEIEFGGGGGTFADALALCHACGYSGRPSGVVSSAVLAVRFLAYATPEQQRSHLPALAEGTQRWTATATMAHPAADAPTATLHGELWTLTGRARYVADLAESDRVVVLAQTDPDSDGATLFVVETTADGSTIVDHRSTSGESLGDLVLDGVVLGDDQRIGPVHGAAPIVSNCLQYATVALASQMVGGAQRALDLTVDYVRARSQFGSELSEFQSVQMRCSEMEVALAGARAIVRAAGLALEAASPDSARLAASAKVWTADAVLRITSEAHQLHGAIGFSAEYGLHRYTRAAIAARSRYGDPEYHRDFVADELRRHAQEGTR